MKSFSSTLSTLTYHQLVVLLFISSLALVQGFCPSKCICENTVNLNTTCIEAGLEEVPIQLNPNVRFINLTHNKIKDVHNSLSFYTQLETLDISGNKIGSLGSKNFEYQDQLRQLYIQKNVIRNLAKDAFKGLIKLEVLDLSDNHIDSIHETAFNELTSLIVLDLNNNSVISIDSILFQNMINLETLLFSNNQLLSVPQTENFENLKKLTHLSLAGNLIEEIDNYAFSHLNQLQTLIISGNVLNELYLLAFDGLTQLNFMDLSDNNLTIVPTEALSKLSNVTILSLSGNFIQTLPAVAFMNLFQLKELHLNRLLNLIRIDPRAFIDNINLQTLTLDDNEEFSDLPAHLFSGNPNLRELSMTNNKLHSLDAAQLPLDQLKKLSLGKNPLVCNCSLIWLWQLIKAASATVKGAKVDADTGLINSSSLNIDKDAIGCDIITKSDGAVQKIIRKRLLDMSDSDIKCPTHIVTIISVIMTVIFIAIICVSILIVIKCSRNAQLKRRQQKYLSGDHPNIGELIIQQKIGKFEHIQQVQCPQNHIQIPMHQYMHPNQNLYIQRENYNRGPLSCQYPVDMENYYQSTSLASSTLSENPMNHPKMHEVRATGPELFRHPDHVLDEDHYETFDEDFLNELNHQNSQFATDDRICKPQKSHIAFL